MQEVVGVFHEIIMLHEHVAHDAPNDAAKLDRSSNAIRQTKESFKPHEVRLELVHPWLAIGGDPRLTDGVEVVLVTYEKPRETSVEGVRNAVKRESVHNVFRAIVRVPTEDVPPLVVVVLQ